MRKFLTATLTIFLASAACQHPAPSLDPIISNLGEVRSSGAFGDEKRTELTGYLYYNSHQKQHYLVRIEMSRGSNNCSPIGDGDAVYLVERNPVPTNADGHMVTLEGTLIFDREGDPLDVNELPNFGRLDDWKIQNIGPACKLR